ncbi:MAG TPA: polysaccharide deacetylase family protein [Actinospica sp.]|nr:polysaccharide deacetylase family protein [Actinospica sp.]
MSRSTSASLRRLALASASALALALLAGCGTSRPVAFPTTATPIATGGQGTAPPTVSGTQPGTARPAPSTVPPSPTSRPTPAPSSPAITAIPARLAGTDWERIPTTRHIVALTFDAGANADAVNTILATLHAEGVPATFFLTGDFVNEFPTAARQIAASERVGNHSLDHPDFTTLTATQISSELTRARQAIQAVTGADPRPLFRFPLGARNAAAIRAVNAGGYVPVRWSVDTLGWKGISGGITAQTVYDRAISGLQPGEIVLMHCGSNPTDHSTLDADTLDRIIKAVKARGYGFVTLDALVN